ncbi:MAG: Calx-beta domain-containing protein [Crocosphaera sp.]
MSDNQTSIEFSSAKYSGFEKDQPFPNQIEVTVTRSGNTDHSSRFQVHLLTGIGMTTAQEGTDFDIMSPEWLEFEPGETEKKVYIDIYDDFELEGTEKIELELTPDSADPSLSVGEQRTTTVEILDNEVSYVEFSDAKFVGMESDEPPHLNQLEVTLTRSGNLNNFADVEVILTDGTAEQYQDFNSPFGFPQIVHFQPGETSTTITIDIQDDFEIEGTESFNLELETSSGSMETVIGEQGTTTVEILDNEISYVEFAAAKFVGMESDEPPHLNQLEVTLTRSGNINNFADAEVMLTGGSAKQYQDFDSPFGFPQIVHFQPGETSTTITIDIQDDFEIEGTESFNLELKPFSGNMETVIGEQGTTTVEILDNEVSYFEFSDAKYITYEEDDAYFNKLQVTVNRSGNLDISNGIHFEIIEGSADYSDFFVNTPWVSFEQGETSQVIEIEVDNDGMFEGTESFQLQLWDEPYHQDDIELGENATTTVEIRDKQTSYIDYLTGETGGNSDIFVLGNTNGSFYDDFGQQDYAEISNFDVSEDVIQLHGVASDYSLGSSPFEPNDQGIFLKVYGMQDDLVGIVKNTNNLDINSNNFAFV